MNKNTRTVSGELCMRITWLIPPLPLVAAVLIGLLGAKAAEGAAHVVAGVWRWWGQCAGVEEC